MRDKRLRDTKCPTCGKTLDAAGTLSGVDEIPAPEDVTVCIHCGDIAQFQSDLSLKHVPDGEETRFGPECYMEIKRIRWAINVVNLKRN